MITAIFVSPQKAAQVQQVPQQIEKIAEQLGAKEPEIIHPYERFPNLAFVVEKDAQAQGKPFCRAQYDEQGKVVNLLYGTFAIVNYADGRCMSLTKGQIKHFLSKFAQPEAISVENGSLTVSKINDQQEENPIIAKLFDGSYNPLRCKMYDRGYSERDFFLSCVNL